MNGVASKRNVMHDNSAHLKNAVKLLPELGTHNIGNDKDAYCKQKKLNKNSR